MQANSTNHVYVTCVACVSSPMLFRYIVWDDTVVDISIHCRVCLVPVFGLDLSLSLFFSHSLIQFGFDLMRSSSIRFVVFNFLAHLLCALVIYLLSKLCCNKILTICFISSDLHLSCLSFLYLAFSFSHLLHFIWFGCVCFGFSISMSFLSLVCWFVRSLTVSPPVSRVFITRAFHSLDPSTDDTAVTSKCLFLFRISPFISIFAGASHPRAHLAFGIISHFFVFLFLAMPFLYLMICSKSAYYPDPLSAKKIENVRTYQMEVHVNMFVQKIAFPTFFVCCHLSFTSPKSVFFYSLLQEQMPSVVLLWKSKWYDIIIAVFARNRNKIPNTKNELENPMSSLFQHTRSYENR